MLLVFATSAATGTLQSLLGTAGTALAVLLLVAIGNPACGGPLAAELLMPGVWRILGPPLPAGAGTALVGNGTYFDGNALTGGLPVLVTYAAAGSFIVLRTGHWRVRSGATELAAAGGSALAA